MEYFQSLQKHKLWFGAQCPACGKNVNSSNESIANGGMHKDCDKESDEDDD